MKKHALMILVLVLFGGSACSSEPGPKEGASAATAVSNHLSLLPETTHLLVYANMKALKETPFGAEIGREVDRKIRNEHDDESYRNFVEKTGFVFERDVQEIWISGGNSGEYDEHNGGAIVRGNFDREKIIDFAKKESQTRVWEQEFEGYKIYRSDSEKNNFAFVFLNDETALIGAEPWLKSVILKTKSDQGVTDNPTMSKFISKIPNKDYFWGVVDMGDNRWAENLRRHGSPFKGAESLEKMKSLVFYTNVDQKAELIMNGDFTTAEEAELFADMLNGFKAMAKMMVSDDKEAIDMLNEIRIKTDGPDLHLTLNVDKNFLDKLEQKRQKFEKIEL